MAMAGGIVMIVLSMLSVAVVCWVLLRYRRKLSRKTERQTLAAEDPLSKMEKGPGYESDTIEHLLKKGLKKQRRSSQGYPERAIVNTDDSDVVEEVDYLRKKMIKQRRSSQGYPENVKSDDSLMTEEEDCLKKGMEKQRSMSQGFALGAVSSDED
ncbi:uncharacterized protein LOC111328551 [Stylophora pistillata]|nr:uncharacterized protein LOC111328551 [Stylophora pistillata]